MGQQTLHNHFARPPIGSGIAQKRQRQRTAKPQANTAKGIHDHTQNLSTRLRRKGQQGYRQSLDRIAKAQTETAKENVDSGSILQQEPSKTRGRKRRSTG